ncbi:MAG TPA: nicotinamide-nucleotide amidase [Gammaproteobacteria bacterium]|nr:nicotinamide-nucleotide amidase [Gammaproteobacteria bacterium]
MNKTPIYQLAFELGQKLKKREWKLVTAESCTGGGLAYAVTEISGSSAWFERGYVTYSNKAKEELLGVQVKTLNEWGAVSQQTAHEMAEGALENSKAQIGIAITGIAGPDGGSIEKPVGMVWFGWAGIHADTITEVQYFSGDRQSVREQAIRFALERLIEFTAG